MFVHPLIWHEQYCKHIPSIIDIVMRRVVHATKMTPRITVLQYT
jgi:hypothetical protein